MSTIILALNNPSQTETYLKGDKTYRAFIGVNFEDYFINSRLQPHFWEDSPEIFGPQDVPQAKGNSSWFAVNKKGRFACVIRTAEELSNTVDFTTLNRELWQDESLQLDDHNKDQKHEIVKKEDKSSNNLGANNETGPPKNNGLQLNLQNTKKQRESSEKDSITSTPLSKNPFRPENLVQQFLNFEGSPKQFADKTLKKRKKFESFNFVFGDLKSQYFISSDRSKKMNLGHGVYVISTDPELKSSMPKVKKTKLKIESILSSGTMNTKIPEIINLMSQLNPILHQKINQEDDENDQDNYSETINSEKRENLFFYDKFNDSGICEMSIALFDANGFVKFIHRKMKRPTTKSRRQRPIAPPDSQRSPITTMNVFPFNEPEDREENFNEEQNNSSPTNFISNYSAKAKKKSHSKTVSGKLSRTSVSSSNSSYAKKSRVSREKENKKK